jgi:hypothetical protein
VRRPYCHDASENSDTEVYMRKSMANTQQTLKVKNLV